MTHSIGTEVIYHQANSSDYGIGRIMGYNDTNYTVKMFDDTLITCTSSEVQFLDPTWNGYDDILLRLEKVEKKLNESKTTPTTSTSINEEYHAGNPPTTQPIPLSSSGFKFGPTPSSACGFEFGVPHASTQPIPLSSSGFKFAPTPSSACGFGFGVPHASTQPTPPSACGFAFGVPHASTQPTPSSSRSFSFGDVPKYKET